MFEGLCSVEIGDLARECDTATTDRSEASPGVEIYPKTWRKATPAVRCKYFNDMELAS
jgi:hypothetical protein